MCLCKHIYGLCLHRYCFNNVYMFVRITHLIYCTHCMVLVLLCMHNKFRVSFFMLYTAIVCMSFLDASGL